MMIHGLQKMTLLDFPGRVACTIFLGGCDFRCPYCQKAELLDGTWPPEMEEETLLRFLQKRRGLLDGVAVTGGEPLLRDIGPLLEKIKAMGFAVKLDTNGTHPDRLADLIRRRLVDYVAMDIKNSPEKYALTVGLSAVDLTPIRKSVSLLLEGQTEYEFRTTVCAQLHKDTDLRAIGQWIQGASRYFIQPFAPRDSVPCQSLTAPGKEALEAFVRAVAPYVGSVTLRGTD